MSLYRAYLVDQGIQSCTLKSYISAIKCILCVDNYKWDDSAVLLHTLTMACRGVNDAIRAHLPICVGLLEIILFECGRLFNNQWYCETLYKTIFILAYYRLFRIGELCEHAVKARNVHVGQNKDKILFILYSSKTHNKGSHPQEIRTSADTLGHSAMSKKNSHRKRNFCPFKLTRQFMHLRGGFFNENENFFICSDGSAVTLS